MPRPAGVKFLAILLLCLCFVTAAKGLPDIALRQEASLSTSFITSTTRGRATSTSTETGSSESGSSSQPPTATTSSTTILSSNTNTQTLIKASSTTLAIPSNLNGPLETNTIKQGNYSYSATPDELPLNISITPAFAVGGAILLITGAVYAFIGIKNKWLHVFLSAAYLAAVSVTVLILFVMNLPVSNSIQGAYLVAIVLTGAVVGGVAGIFNDLTQGLGCFLGGFSLSMWLLAMKPGGLVDSTAGKVIFISAFSLTAFAASFSQYTRDYALIGCISFSGATAAVLGLDCFTRAGLKEFWAYIWDLNANLFPAGATSYPVTREMKVELAAVVVMFIAGIISQLKIWQMIKIRRVQKTIQTTQNRYYMDKQESKIGRRIENQMGREIQQWEAIYGDKDRQSEDVQRYASKDSGVGGMEGQKRSARHTSVRHSGEDEIEMAPLPAPKVDQVIPAEPKISPIVIRVAQDQAPNTDSVASSSMRDTSTEKDVSDASRQSLVNEQARATDRTLKRRSSDTYLNRTLKPGPTEEPEVVPLPFKVSDKEDDNDDASSVATIATEKRRNSKRLSVSSGLLRKASKRSQRISHGYSGDQGESSEDLVIPRIIEDDRASSIAATLDDLSDVEDARSERSSIVHRSIDLGTSKGVETIPNENKKIETLDKERSMSGETPAGKDHDSEPIIQSEREALAQPSLSPSPGLQGQSACESLDAEGQLASSNEIGETPSSISMLNAGLTEDNLPRMSKVVMTYRTNEWAKHLSHAENPELDELQHEKYALDDEEKPVETAKPVDMEALQETVDSIPPRSVSQMSTRAIPTRSGSTMSTASPMNGSTSVIGYYPQVGGLSRNASQQSVPQHMGLRSSSTPAIVPLFGRKDSIIHARQSYYGNGAALASTPEFPHGSSSSSEMDPISHSTTSINHEDSDNVSLAARRQILRQSSLQYPPSAHHNMTSFDSLPQKRQSTLSHSGAREMQLASWRASVAQDFQNAASPVVTMERSRSALFQERQAEEQRRALQAQLKAQKERAFDERMRSKDMMVAHRDALRKMQAKANKSVA